MMVYCVAVVGEEYVPHTNGMSTLRQYVPASKLPKLKLPLPDVTVLW